MVIREQMDTKSKKSKTVGITVGIALIVIGAATIIYESASSGAPAAIRAASAGDQYYTVDDGATYFAESADRLAPFDHDGKTAVRAYVFKCEGKSPFVGYLERYTPAGLKAQAALAAADRQSKATKSSPRFDPRNVELAATGREVKKPGDKSWIPARSAGGIKLTVVKCPNGANALPVQP